MEQTLEKSQEGQLSYKSGSRENQSTRISNVAPDFQASNLKRKLPKTSKEILHLLHRDVVTSNTKIFQTDGFLYEVFPSQIF